MSISLKPQFSDFDAAQLSNRLFGIRGTALLLTGERDQNFLIEAEEGKKYVLKIANRDEDKALILAQAYVMIRLVESGCKAPIVVKGLNGEIVSEAVSKPGDSYLVWMLEYFEGVPLGTLRHHSSELLLNIGIEAGKFDFVLSQIEDPLFKRKFDWDLCIFDTTVKKYLSYVSDPELHSFVSDTLLMHQSVVAPVESSLRKSVIHNDLNDYNIIVASNGGYNSPFQLAGIVDFGDALFSYTISNLAVAISYAMLDKADPLAAALDIVRGYSGEFKLLPQEIDVLHTFVRMRLSVSICMAGYQKSLRPDDEYLSISQEPIKRSIKLIEAINPDLAETSYRLAAQELVGERYQNIISYLRERGPEAYPILGKKPTKKNCLVLDLSVNSLLISGNPEENGAGHLSDRVSALMAHAGAEFGVGRYNEPRTLYTSPLFNRSSFTESDDRTIHLGIDLFDKAGSPIYSPYDAVIESFAYNPEPLDYGNVIILKHLTTNGAPFYTLYGHLSSDSLKGKTPGDKLDAGDLFATTGKSSENGGWAPHLHFQIISDLKEFDSDFPGVCSQSERESWIILSPDPNLILGIPDSLFPKADTTVSETYTSRLELTGKNLSVGYKNHIKMARGWMQYMYDSDGIRYLDAYNNVPHVGHCHPEVIEASYQQMRKLNTNTRYLYNSINEYAELLLSTFPSGLNRCYFLNSASEANELALRLAFNFTGNRDVVVLEGAYHGNTNSLIDISPYKHNGPGGRGAPAWVHTALVADCYRGEYGYNDPDAGRKYGSKVGDIVDSLASEGKGVAAFIAETCPSVGGQIIFPEGYLKEVYRHIRRAGGVCIADEVQTGYGRVGTSFYAFTDQGVVPDIVVLGKPIGNGHPIGAVICTTEISEAFNNGMEFFSTFGGNSVSSVTGRKVLEITLRDKLQEHSLKVGTYLLKNLKEMQKSYSLIGDVRGSGLFTGIELVKSLETLEPATEEAAWISNRLRDHKILIGTDGPFHNVLKIRPPLPFDIADADILLDRLNRIFKI